MLTMRQEQLEVFNEHHDRRSAQLLAPHFRENWPLQTADFTDGELEIWIQARLAVGRALGLSAAASRAHLANLCCLLGEWFFEEPEFAWAKTLLTDSTLPEEERVDRIYLRLCASR